MDHEIQFSGNTKARSRLLIVCAVLAILFAITTAVFVALFTYTHIMFAGRADPTPEKIDNPSEITTPAPATDMICNTPECVATAGRMISKMDLDADPCVDFNEFACGRYISEALIPDGETSVGTITARAADNLLIIKGILTEEVMLGEASSLTHMKNAYMSCMEEVKVEGAGIQNYLSEPAAQEWITINPNFDGTNFQLYLFIAGYMAAEIAPFYTIEKSTDYSKMAVVLGEGTLGLERDFFFAPRDDPVIMAYQTYLTDIAVELGASREVAEQDAKDVVDLEIALAKIRPAKEEGKDVKKVYDKLTLEDFSIQYPAVEVSEVVRQLAVINKYTLSGYETIENRLPEYLGNLSRVIKDFSTRTLQNIFGFKYAIYRTMGSSNQIIAIQNAFNKAYYGQVGEKPQWENCVTKVAAKYTTEIQEEFVARAFSNDVKAGIEEMFNQIVDTFRQMVAENTWMSNATKEEVYKKVAAITLQITGYNYEEEDGETEAITNQNFLLSDENNFGSQAHKHNISQVKIKAPWDPRHVKQATFSRRTSKQLSVHSILDGRLINTAYGTGASFTESSNEMKLDYGLLLPPFYSNNAQGYLNYGALGLIIGHELTHGFDDTGVEFDEKGELRDWWQPSEKEEFFQRMQCIIDQTSSFYVEEIGMHLNGFYTQSECVGDTSGLKEAFRAYKDAVRKKGEETSLPGLSLTPDQLFFLSYGQAWCEKSTKEAMARLVNTDPHPPNKYRIYAALQNSEDFAMAYNCPLRSYMNPVDKCDVW